MGDRGRPRPRRSDPAGARPAAGQPDDRLRAGAARFHRSATGGRLRPAGGGLRPGAQRRHRGVERPAAGAAVAGDPRGGERAKGRSTGDRHPRADRRQPPAARLDRRAGGAALHLPGSLGPPRRPRAAPPDPHHPGADRLLARRRVGHRRGHAAARRRRRGRPDRPAQRLPPAFRVHRLRHDSDLDRLHARRRGRGAGAARRDRSRADRRRPGGRDPRHRGLPARRHRRRGGELRRRPDRHGHPRPHRAGAPVPGQQRGAGGAARQLPGADGTPTGRVIAPRATHPPALGSTAPTARRSVLGGGS